MTNFTELKQRFPKAFSLFERYVERHYETRLALFLDKIRNEDLVNFLDNNGLFVNVSPYQGVHQDIEITFEADILCTFMYQNYVEEFFDRSQATEAAIVKAFELLEHKLKLN